ncbi:nucleotidyltransferase family protein [Nocardia sp. alder85J]|uniref:nucleotidyltransferase family protein n=1 Tax=Nocardia sp. alder85J TaxID=2862949 RepID=UPI001CD49E66|nr:NTP transferase domain-containing protein [Nocardia sp. alder85J]MCX4098852.1 NTP transferase domain-containing protein [Nocardia sp. alder85J]
MTLGRCDGIVLAAGAGTRYGRPKALAADGDWLRSAVAALRGGGCAEVVVVLGATGPARPVVNGGWRISEQPAIDLPAAARSVWAADWATGLSASLRAGLGALTAESGAPAAEYAAIMPVDTPDVGPAVVARVLAAARAADSGLARAVFDDAPGHPVVIAHKHWTGVIDSARGDSGARTFLDKRPDMVAVTCDDLATGRDHDYPHNRAR